ncbi:MAG TPA: hypothetical protein VG708_00950 [Mycobacteriales bacterium]|nr:hypothetical protein [Mycobacteriales bacterium]
MIAAIIIASGVLIGLAVHHTHVSNHRTVRHVSAGPTSPASSSSSGLSTVNAATVTSDDSSEAPLFAAADTKVAWRAIGGCSGSPHLGITTDGGRSWGNPKSPAPHVLALGVTGASSGWVVGADAQCKPTYYTTSDGGQTWQRGSGLNRVWFLTPSGLRAPGQTATTPCGKSTPIAVAATSVSGAVVVCPTGVFRTTTAGDSWTAAGQLPSGHPAAVGLNGNGAGVIALAGVHGCAGLQIATTADAGRSWSAGSCLRLANPPAGVGFGSSGAGVLNAVGVTYTSTDAGRSWSSGKPSI